MWPIWAWALCTAHTWTIGSSAANIANQQPSRTDATRLENENRRIGRESMLATAKTAEASYRESTKEGGRARRVRPKSRRNGLTSQRRAEAGAELPAEKCSARYKPGRRDRGSHAGPDAAHRCEDRSGRRRQWRRE